MNPRLETGGVLAPSPLITFIIHLLYNNLSTL
jgi:hypothetical protein